MKKLLDLYYIIWVDTIVKFKSIPINKDDWKYKSLMLVSVAMGMQFFLILMLFEIFVVRIDFYNLNLDIFPGDRLDGMLNGTILFFIPFFILNYFLIFWRNRYKKLIEKYEYKNGKYSMIYLLGTFFGFALLMLVGLIAKLMQENGYI